MSNPTTRPAPRHTDTSNQSTPVQPEIPGIQVDPRIRPEDVFTMAEWLQWRDDRRTAAARRSRHRRALGYQPATLAALPADAGKVATRPPWTSP